ncbi:MAG TPA: tetratricopeptide repeat protein [Chitinophaga sp.]|uniref:type IX secretion system periplasmic lipoprotein PorW/SprE n=1 Tax=Chitinophaga sp. TaxID=1869181 RepID=UPI002C860D2B|nr:tetratricopeptide repeat protein [Chitinophaga sp.]HVI45651.1 tetratricopeptide repeat protein [Chitinophaga sp.]
MNSYKSLKKYPVLFSLLFCLGLPTVIAQNKPRDNQSQQAPQSNQKPQAHPKPLFKPREPKVQDRRPPSEVMLEKKRWTIVRKFFQNMATRFNYYFHARVKLDRVVKTASRSGQDNYNVLLPFYPASLQNQGYSKAELDSVIEKTNMAIQLHDPRGKWIDDCFLLMGRAYFYEGDFENANKTFQYINLAFAPRKKSEYKTVIGANENDQISIANREKTKGFLSRFRHKSARNDAFLWRAKTLLELKEYDEVQALLNILQADPNFPHRLDGGLAEVRAYSNYMQGRYAETIDPLQVAIDKSHDKVAKARMSFILGQLYVMQHRNDSAMDQFRHVIRLKPDPMMDFQARLQIAKMNATTDGGLAQSQSALRHMLKKERFSHFRDAILYTMGTLEYPKDPEAALNYMQQSLKVSSDNIVQRTLTYKGIADIYYDQRKYLEAKKYYDSTAGVMTPDFADAAIVNTRKEVLTEVAAKVAVIQREDSLRRLAVMPESDRNILLAKMAATIRTAAAEKKKKDAMQRSNSYDNPAFGFNNADNSYGPKEEKGDWYFYNQSSKASGYSEFKRRWGNRQATDNWRRSQSGVVNQANSNAPIQVETAAAEAPGANVPPDSLTGEVLAKGLPLTPEKLAASVKLSEDAWFELGKLYHDKLENFPLAIETYDSLLLQYPNHPRKPEVLYSLYIWNGKLNRTAEAERYKTLVLNQYGNTNFADIIRSGGLKDVDAAKKKQISQAYDSAYTAFMSGDVAGALARKRAADTAFGVNFLQPKFDLLEAMIVVKNDTLSATDSLQLSRKAVTAVMNKYASDPAIKAQAQALLDALDHRAELVNYLAQLQIRKDEGGGVMVDENISMRYPWQNPQPVLVDRLNTAKTPLDSSKIAANVKGAPTAPIATVQPPKPVTPYKLSADNPYFVVLAFNRVSKDLMDEGLNQFTRYNAAKHASEKIEVGSFVLTPNDIMLIFRIFPNEDKALTYFDEIREEAAVSIIPRIRPTEYTFFVISRDNFILLNSTKDISGYRKFFVDNYVTQ